MGDWIHHRLVHKAGRSLHFGHGFLRCADQRLHFAPHLLDQAHDLESSVTEQCKGDKRHEKCKKNKDIYHRLSIDKAEEDQHRNEDQAANSSADDLAIYGAPPYVALGGLYHGVRAILTGHSALMQPCTCV